jgi:hypothetical protein
MSPVKKPPETAFAYCATCGHSEWVHSNAGFWRCLKPECGCEGFIVGAAPEVSAQVFPA